MKTLRFIGIFTVIFALVACSCVSVAAEETDYIPQQIEFIVDSARTIMGYDGSDEAYNSYIESTGAASSVGLMIETLNRIGNVGDFFAGTPIDFVCDNVTLGEEVLDGKFRGIIANRDFVDRLYNFCNNYGASAQYSTLDDYAIDLGSVPFQVNTINVIGDVLSYKPTQSYNGFDGYYDLSSAVGYNGVTFLSGGATPPIMFVPRNVHIRQNGIDMYNNSDNMVYVLAGNNLMYGASMSYTTRNIAAIFMYYSSSSSAEPTAVQLCNGLASEVITDSNTGKYLFGTSRSRSSFAVFRDVVKGSIMQSPTPVSELNSVFQLFAALKGRLLVFSGDTVEPVSPPSDVPYNGDDNVMIYMDIDEGDDTVNYDYGIRYMPINDFSTNIDNSKINYDYSNHVSNDQTVNNTINNYYYITENGGFDDIAILDRLDTIIKKLQRIIDDNKAFRNEVMTAILSDQPIYTDYMDCLADNLPILQTVDTIKNQAVGSDSGITELNSWLSSGSRAPVASGASEIDTDTQSGGLPISFNTFPINLSWYEPYRVRVRDLLKFPTWGFVISGCWLAIKSIFGVQVGGES